MEGMKGSIGVGVVESVSVEDGVGVFARIVVEPMGIPMTCRVASPYPGLYFPVAVNSEWIVVIPQGECASEPIALAPLWSRAMIPPAGAAQEPTQVWLDAGSGTVNVVGGTVQLGGAPLDALLDGVVTRRMRCAYTGAAHPEASGVVRAKGV